MIYYTHLNMQLCHQYTSMVSGAKHLAQKSTGISFGYVVYMTLRINKIHPCTSKSAAVLHLWKVYSARSSILA